MSQSSEFPKLVAVNGDGSELPIEGHQLLIKFKDNRALSITLTPEALSFVSYCEDDKGNWCSDKAASLNVELSARNILNLRVSSPFIDDGIAAP